MKMIAILTGPSTYLDHLGPLSTLLNIPLFISEESTYHAAQTYYPMVNACLIEPLELSLPFLAQYDAIFTSGHFWAAELIPMLEIFQDKKIRVIYVPHGNSDKGYSQKQAVCKDISLVYGQQMIDALQHTQQASLITTGNYRLPFYQQHQNFYDSALLPYLRHFQKHKPTILYAPTWTDGENESSFFDFCNKIIDELIPYFNLMIKLHPFLFEQSPSIAHQTISRLEHYKDQIALLHDFPPIYPILQAADAYLGDFSSIGYDYLHLNRPLFFLQDKPSPLATCGRQIPSNSHFGNFILNNWDQTDCDPIKKNLYHYAFDDTQTTELLAKIQEALSHERASWI